MKTNFLNKKMSHFGTFFMVPNAHCSVVHELLEVFLSQWHKEEEEGSKIMLAPLCMTMTMMTMMKVIMVR
jgi:hypothetical protein